MESDRASEAFRSPEPKGKPPRKSPNLEEPFELNRIPTSRSAAAVPSPTCGGRSPQQGCRPGFGASPTVGGAFGSGKEPSDGLSPSSRGSGCVWLRGFLKGGC